jgi:hypothetical protein
MNQKKFLSIRETAKAGVISEHHLRQMVAQGQAPGFYVGSHFRVNVPMLIDKLDKMSAVNGGDTQ